MRYYVAKFGYLSAIIIGVIIGVMIFIAAGSIFEDIIGSFDHRNMVSAKDYLLSILIFMVIPLLVLFVCISIPFYLYSLVAKIDPNPRTDRLIAEKKVKDNEQRRCMQSILELNENALVEFESLPVSLAKAEYYLNQADRYFAEGAFSPFWESVENAASHLAYFRRSTHNIYNNLHKYTKYASEYEGMVPSFPVNMPAVKGIKAGNCTGERLDRIVRQAQKNFQFASIYEQRKTNQILFSGFKNLAEALSSLSYEVSYSIERLGESIDDLSLRVTSSLDAFRQESGEYYSGVEMRLEKATDMLNKIQRNRDVF